MHRSILFVLLILPAAVLFQPSLLWSQGASPTSIDRSDTVSNAASPATPTPPTTAEDAAEGSTGATVAPQPANADAPSQQQPSSSADEEDKPKVKAPTTKVDPRSCVTAECHADTRQHRVLHGPLNVNACDACHRLVNAEKHQYELTRDRDQLCAFCHQTNVATEAHVHQPVAEGSCLDCHDAHGGFDRNFLKTNSMRELCATCHADVTANMKNVHGPVAAGACGACHPAHSAPNRKLLNRTGRDLCLSCHQDMSQQLSEARHGHEPAMQGDCSVCHDPHASNHVMVTRKAPMQLCTDACHQDVRAAVNEAEFKHSAVTRDAACTNCHTSHGSELDALMKQTPINLCLDCHSEAIETDGRVVASVNELANENLFRHGPVAQGSCGGCHNVHGSNVSRLLTKAYPATFYTSYDEEQYGLCFSCHNKQLVELRETRGLTGFRDGAVNLHYLHVNKVKRGRSCRACHTTHASRFPVHVRESVPYGSWEMPINFKQTATGGSCQPGCHQAFGYDRDQPVNAQAPATPEADANEEATR